MNTEKWFLTELEQDPTLVTGAEKFLSGPVSSLTI